MVKTVQDGEGGLADPTTGEEVFEHMVAEQQHELAAVESGDRFKAAVGGPDSAACDGMDMGMEIEAIAVALHGEDDSRSG